MTNRARSTLQGLAIPSKALIGPSGAHDLQCSNSPHLNTCCPAHTAQNATMRHITGAFRITPVDPLHQLMEIMPIKLRMKMLIKNTAPTASPLAPN